jgi:hypothetical protein
MNANVLRDLASDAIPPIGLRDWLTQASASWEACPRADWMLWLASRIPDLGSDEQRAVVGAATELWSEQSMLGDLFAFFRPIPSRHDVLVAWSRTPDRRFDFAHGLAASNQAFALGLVAAVIIDRRFFAGSGDGATRTMTQAALFLATWLVLSGCAGARHHCSGRRARIRRAAGEADADGSAAPTYAHGSVVA